MMLITDLAARDVETARDSLAGACLRALRAVFGRASDHRLPTEIAPQPIYRLRSVPTAPAGTPALRAVVQADADDTVDLQWRRHPQLRTPAAPITMQGQRSARLEAERGVILARGGKNAGALEAFSAAAADPRIDLTLLPGFWDLPRQGMMTAVRAYERNRRIRDAAALEARLRHTMRPRGLKPLPPPRGPVSASGD